MHPNTLIDLIKAYGAAQNIDRAESIRRDLIAEKSRAGELTPKQGDTSYEESWDRQNAASEKSATLLAQITERLESLSDKADGFDLYRATLREGRH